MYPDRLTARSTQPSESSIADSTQASNFCLHVHATNPTHLTLLTPGDLYMKLLTSSVLGPSIFVQRLALNPPPRRAESVRRNEFV